MGCPAEVVIGDNLVFAVTTHNPLTLVAADADSVPSYRIYESETGTAILTGSMAKLDDANTTGLYSESVACAAANGFEDGKTYTVYIEGTVAGYTGAKAYSFTAVVTDLADVKAKTDLISAANVTLVSAVTADSQLELVQGDDYAAADGTQLTWTDEDYSGPSLTSATCTLTLMDQAEYDAGSGSADLTQAGTVTMDGADAVFKVDLTSAQTAGLSTTPPDDRYNYRYHLLATLSNGRKLSIALGGCRVKQRIA